MLTQVRGLLAASARSAFSLACLGTGAYAFAYLHLEFRGADPFAQSFAVSGPDVPAHFFGAGLALLLVPLQLSDRVRMRWPALHRTAGLLSAAAILGGGLSGLSLARDAQGGWVARSGFAVLSLLWIGATMQGVRLAVRGEYRRHRRWMAASIAMTSAAVTLRVMLALGAGLLQLPFMPVYATAAWASWLFNLAVCAWVHRAPEPRGVGATRWVSRRPSA